MDKNEKAKTSVILKDFLKQNPQNAGAGLMYNPDTNRWERNKNASNLQTMVPKPMSKAWYTLPDFLDDELLRFLKFQMGGGKNG